MLKPQRIVAVLVGLLALVWAPRTIVAQQQVSQPKYKITVDKDVRIPLRDGGYLSADVYRPDAPGEKFPVLMSLSAYQKELQFLPAIAPFTHQERPEPDWWVPRGYTLIFVDTRGTGRSPGLTEIWSKQEAFDYYDAIEWAGVQSFGTGKVGLAGVSYYALTQWTVASLQPPHLTTIVPWEGWADLYRDNVFQGGLFNEGFYGGWWLDVMGKQLLDVTRKDNPGAMNENLLFNYMTHPLDSPYWDNVKGRAQMDKLTLPIFSAGNWQGWNHHLRGNIEAFMRSPSPNKHLRVHIGGHTFAFYEDEGKMDMLRWYDYWLKGIKNGVMDEPPVKLCVRTSTRECTWRYENEWPIQRTEYTKFYLNPQPSGVAITGTSSTNIGSLSKAEPSARAQMTYDAGPTSEGRGGRGIPAAAFLTEPMTEDVEITGHTNLVMWVSSETEDMDVFAFLKKINPDGSVETASRGMLKVSHRQLDPKLSTPYRPYHTHAIEQKLQPNEVVPIEVEIWATSMVFQKGSRIRIDVMPSDGGHYFSSYHLKNNSIYTGAGRASYVLLPIVPAKAGAQLTKLGGIKVGPGGGD